MKAVLLICLAVFGTATAETLRGNVNLPAPRSREATEKMFNEWQANHGQEFDNDTEYLKRLAIFSENLDKIERHNADMSQTFKMKMNAFGHLTGEEFKAMYTGLKVPEVDHTFPRIPFVPRKLSETPKSVDWTTKGAVTPVKNQAQCGSCWAFSTTGGLEGAYFLKHKKLVSFSEQQLVSCDKTCNGCGGGLMDSGFAWIKQNGGLCTEKSYPYSSGGGVTGTCKSSCKAVKGSKVSSFVDVSPKPQQVPATVSAMEAAVAQQPISVAIEADQSSFQFYSSGVMTSTCGTQLDHGVLVVGYGTQGKQDYWKIKNSWGASWGQEGYIMIGKGMSQKGGQCGVLLSASYPKL